LGEIGARLGADVAFLAGSAVAAIGTGRGEQLRPVDALPPREMLIAVPPFSIATADAYRWLDESRVNAAPFARATPSSLDWESVAKLSRNDFEPVTEVRHPELRVLRERLRASGAGIARLAGSGSSVFGVFDSAVSDASVAGPDAAIIATRSSERVVPVEVAE